ncbi:MAG: FAD-dependent oxidoreductase [Clostridia bacterium]|nr:FAD-dependent oxidoreductase [Clostridia bacterium]
MKKYKCRMCEYIYENEDIPFEDLDAEYRCPVCGADKLMFDLYSFDLVIVGGGIAGVSAAIKARELNENVSIKLISNESAIYNRIRLIDLISGSVSMSELLLYKADYLKSLNVEVIYNKEIKNFDFENKMVDDIKYDKLIMATGAKPFVPELDVDKDKILTVRTIKDVIELNKVVKDDAKVCVVGAGVLGIEVAAAMTYKVMSVDIVANGDRIIPRQLSKKGSDILIRHLKKKNVEVIFNSVNLNDYDYVIVCTGVRTESVDKLEFNRGIIIDSQMKTNIKDVYAAGDCTEYEGKMYGLWSVAMEQGELAAESAVSEELEYNGSKFQTKIKVAGIDIFSVGDFDRETGDIEEVTESDKYYKIVKEEGKIIGAVVVSDNNKAMDILSEYRRG